jgi:hypothetical protein
VLEADTRTMTERAGNPAWTVGVTVLTVLASVVLLWQAYLVLGS